MSLAPSKYMKAVSAFAVLVIILLLLNELILPLFGWKIVYDSGRFRFGEYAPYSRMESALLGVLINDTLLLGEIPQQEYLILKTGIDEEEMEKCLISLVERKDIAINDSGAIVEARPWSSIESGFMVFLTDSLGAAADSFNTVSAFYALSTPFLFSGNAVIRAVMVDTGDTLKIVIDDGHITNVSHLTAVVYRNDDFRDSEFFSSGKGVEKYMGNGINMNRVLRLDKALRVGSYIAEELRKKIE